jgi:hypothetical protein
MFILEKSDISSNIKIAVRKQNKQETTEIGKIYFNIFVNKVDL